MKLKIEFQFFLKQTLKAKILVSIISCLFSSHVLEKNEEVVDSFILALPSFFRNNWFPSERRRRILFLFFFLLRREETDKIYFLLHLLYKTCVLSYSVDRMFVLCCVSSVWLAESSIFFFPFLILVHPLFGLILFSSQFLPLCSVGETFTLATVLLLPRERDWYLGGYKERVRREMEDTNSERMQFLSSYSSSKERDRSLSRSSSLDDKTWSPLKKALLCLSLQLLWLLLYSSRYISCSPRFLFTSFLLRVPFFRWKTPKRKKSTVIHERGILRYLQWNIELSSRRKWESFNREALLCFLLLTCNSIVNWFSGEKDVRLDPSTRILFWVQLDILSRPLRLLLMRHCQLRQKIEAQSNSNQDIKSEGLSQESSKKC